ncbi:MAG TPA: site-specific DNA-methyltransferase, partial [Candidatus Hydrogenedentes bacterium]|nr:site-specific DNA-methyltransferase [Candidatus Hydrogenedentota bacterium]
AHHVFFTEMREPLPGVVDGTTPLLGVARETAVYLLYNGVLKDKRPKGGNVLTMETLRGLPPHAGPKVVYGTACTLGAGTLRRHGVTFRQIPYEVKCS